MAFVIDGIAYVGTGYGDYDIDLQQYIYYNDLWAYDPVTDEWTEKAPYPGSGREGLVSFAINGKGYFIPIKPVPMDKKPQGAQA